jgi:hypothetical protein
MKKAERRRSEMAEKKNAKYVITTYKKDSKLPDFRKKMDPRFVKPITTVDADTVPGAEFYSETMWILPGDKSENGMVQMESHTHDWGEMIGFFGFNYENIKDLGCEIEFTVDNEKHIIREAFTAFIPAGVQHGPLIIRNVRIPVFQFIAGPTERYQ